VASKVSRDGAFSWHAARIAELYTRRVRPDLRACLPANVRLLGDHARAFGRRSQQLQRDDGKRMTLKSPAAMSAAALAGLMACT
jgi:hypothetical protein